MENKQITTVAKPIWTALIAQPDKYYEALPAISVKQIVTNSHPVIGLIKTQVKNGEQLTQAILVLELEALNKFFNVPQMTPEQRIETVKLACEVYHYWKLDDFKFVFKGIKTGRYGKIFNRIDGGFIFECFRIHDGERKAEKELINKVEPLTKPNPEGQKKVIEILSEFVEKDKEFKKPEKAKVKSEYDLVCQSALTEFDKIYKGGKETNGKRFIEVNGRMMDQVEFMEYKIELYKQQNKDI